MKRAKVIEELKLTDEETPYNQDVHLDAGVYDGLKREAFDEGAKAQLDKVFNDERIAVVDRKAKLPDKLMVDFYLDPEYTMTSKAGLSVAKTATMAYSQSQQAMLKADYVLEVKE